MYSQVAYTYAPHNAPAYWWAPGRNWTATWVSASGKTKMQMVAIDTSPLLQAYYSNPDALNSTGRYNGLAAQGSPGAATCPGTATPGATANTVNLNGAQGAYARGAGTGYAMASQYGTQGFQCGKPLVMYSAGGLQAAQPASPNVCLSGQCGCTLTASNGLASCSAACVGVANASQSPGVATLNSQAWRRHMV